MESDTVDRFTEHISALPPPAAHEFVPQVYIVFSHGTVVMLEDPPAEYTPTQALPFGRKYVETWPLERITPHTDIYKHIADAVAEYTAAADKYGTGLIYRAYSELITCGYPTGATSTVSVSPSGIHIVGWGDAALDRIVNILPATASPEVSLLLGVECRRLDYMFPKVDSVLVNTPPNG